MQRTYAQPLTIELLTAHVPLVKAGQEANQQLEEKFAGKTAMSRNEREEQHALQVTARKGQDSQEILILSALPLIKNITSKEYSRRQAWTSRVSYEELLQEAVYGFIRGLLAFNPDAIKHSATNYLGHWISTNIRRRIETLEHDFSIPYEVVERNRRITAVRSRLTAEMKRPPTDEELLHALNDKNQPANNKWGKVNKPAPTTPAAPAKPSRATTFTQAHLDAAKELNSKLYAMESNEPADSEEETSYEKYSTPISSQPLKDITDIEEAALKETKKVFFQEVFLLMKIGSKQRDIILRYFGLEPYNEPQIYKEIVQQTGLPSRFVKNVVMQFNQYMPLRGGVFHYKLLQLDPEAAIDLELDWLLTKLGTWPENTRTPIPPPTTLTALK